MRRLPAWPDAHSQGESLDELEGNLQEVVSMRHSASQLPQGRLISESRAPEGSAALTHSDVQYRLLPRWEHPYTALEVRIVARRALREFWEKHADAEQPLRAWFDDVRRADWGSPADVKRVYANASIVGENRVVFNISGNKYRLVVAVNYPYRMRYIRFVGTHQAYDRIDVATV